MPPARAKAKMKAGPKSKSRPRARSPSPTPSPSISPSLSPSPSPSPSLASDELLTLKCIYCKAKIAFQELPATGYARHLRSHHKIEFDHDFIINRTMEKQFPQFAVKQVSKNTRTTGVQTNTMTSPSLFGASSSPVKKALNKVACLPKVEIKKIKQEEELGEEIFEKGKRRSSVTEAPKKVVLTRVRQHLPWFSGCEYRCKICQELFFLVDDLRKHIRSAHQTTSDDYVDKYDAFETKTAFIKCRVCNSKIKQNFTAIANHLWLQHEQMLVETYQNKYKVKDREVDLEVPRAASQVKKAAPKAVSEVKRVAPKASSPGPSRPGPKSAKRKLEEKEVVPPKRSRPAVVQESDASRLARRLWYQGYEYKCRTCGLVTFYDPDEFVSHVQSQHNFDKSAYTQKYGQLCSKSGNIKCEICEDNLRHTRPAIEKHLEKIHGGMTLEVYEECFASLKNTNGARKTRPRKKSEEEEDSEWKADTEMMEEEDDEEFDVPDLASSESEDEVKLIEKAMKEMENIKKKKEERVDKKNGGDHPEEEEEKEEDTYTLEEFLKGGCTYQCSVCSSKFESSTKFWSHVESEHKTSPDDYRSKHPLNDYLIKQAKIECAVCYKIIRHEPGAWGQHCSKAHGMTLEAFHKKYYDHSAAEEEENGIVARNGSTSKDMQEAKENFTKWWSQGAVDCVICKKVVHLGYVKHVQTMHGLTEAHYESQHGAVPTSSDVFKCRVCKKTYPFSRTVTAKHIQTHGLTVEAYYMVHHEEPTTGLEAWQYGCEYDCRVCGKKIQAYGILQNHLKLAHKTSVEEYKRSYGDMMSKQVEKKCDICQKDIKWYPWNIEKHFNTHGWTVPKYYYMNVCPPNWVGNRATVNGGSGVNGRSGRNEGYTDGDKIEDFHKWKSGGCQADCMVPGCDSMPASIRAFEQHMSYKHPELSRQQYRTRYRNGDSVMTRKRKLLCGVCNNMILFDFQANVKHFQSHGLTLPAYFEKYARNKVWKLGVTYFDGNDKQPKMASKNISKLQPSRSDTPPMPISNAQLSQTDPETRQAFMNWRDQCVYRCGVCSVTFGGYMAIYNHVSNHKMTIAEHRAKYGSELEKEVRVPCPVCNRSVRSESGAWKSHAKTHKLDAFDIFQFYGHKPKSPLEDWEKNSEYLQCKLCKFETKAGPLGEPNMATHLNSHSSSQRDALLAQEATEEGGSGNQSGYLKRVKTHKCLICGLKVQQNADHISKHMKSVHGIDAEDYSAGFLEKRMVQTGEATEDFEGLVLPDLVTWLQSPSQIICQICNTPCDSKTGLEEHLALDHHKMTLEEYCTTNGEIDTRFFDCRICHSSVERTQEALVLHLADAVHNQISAEAYYEKYHVAEEAPPRRYVGRWEEGCKYACTMCQQDTDNLVHLRHHCIVEHDLSGPLLEGVIASGQSTTVHYKCSICNVEVEQNAQSLKEHFATHGKNIAQYFNDYVWVKPNSLDQEPNEEGDWMLGCQITCLLCHSTLSSKKEHQEHIETAHPGQFNAPTQTSSQVFICKMCSMSFDHDPSEISSHLMDHHFLTPEGYKQQFPGNPKTVIANAMSDRLSDNSSPGSNSLKRKTNFRWNQNPVQCYLCSLVSTSKHALTQHVVKSHKTGFDSRKIQESGPQIMHKCLLCQQSIKMEVKNISGHLWSSHKIDIYAYEMQFHAELGREFASLQSVSEMAVPTSASSSNGDFVPQVFDVDPSSVDSSIVENGNITTNGFDDGDAAIELDFEQLLSADTSQIAATSTEGIEMEYFNVPPLAGPPMPPNEPLPLPPMMMMPPVQNQMSNTVNTVSPMMVHEENLVKDEYIVT